MKPDCSSDAIVVGAGIVGLCVAYYLSQRDLNVLVLDRRFMGSGTSGAGNGNIIVGNRTPGMDTQMARLSLQEYQQLGDTFDLDFELQNRGSFVLLEKETDVSSARALIREQAQAGVRLDYHEGTEMRRIVPLLSGKCRAGMYCRDDSEINPLLFARALKESIGRRGGRFQWYQEVVDIGIEKSGTFKVVTQADEFSCPILVNCAGIDARRIARMVGDEIPLVPNKGHIIVTEKVPSLDLPCTLRDWGDVDLDRDRSETSSISKHVVNFVSESTRAGNLLIGKCEELGNASRAVSVPVVAEILGRAVELIPDLLNVKVIRMYAGLRPQSIDGVPIIGESTGTRSFYYATGHGGDGIALAPITGKLLCEQIVDGRCDMDLSGYSPSRFTGTAAHHTGG